MPSTAIPHAMAVLVRKLESATNLSAAERDAVQSLPMKTRTLPPRQDIVRDGDTPSQSFLLLSGWACRYKLLSEGRRQIFSFHMPGDIPDLQSLHIPALDHSLCALTEATVGFIPHESLRDLTARFPALAALFWRDTLIDAATFRVWMVGMGQRSAYGQVAHLFCELYSKLQAVGLGGDYHCPFPITQRDLGDALGLSNVHVNRVLQEMRGKSLITLRRSTLVIERWNELIAAAEFDPTYLHLEKQAAG